MRASDPGGFHQAKIGNPIDWAQKSAEAGCERENNLFSRVFSGPIVVTSDDIDAPD